jgi:hypothetical protein
LVNSLNQIRHIQASITKINNAGETKAKKKAIVANPSIPTDHSKNL